MYLCYIDESGTSDIPGNTSHFVLAGFSIPIQYWKSCDRDIETIKRKYHLGNTEIHLGWILRPYLEQTRIENFGRLSYSERRSQVEQFRKAELFRLQKVKNKKRYHQVKKNFKETNDYIHLTYDERKEFIKVIAQCVSKWGFARVFAECIDKVFFDPSRRTQTQTIDAQCFEQIVSRFEHFLQLIGVNNPELCCGLLIHDNNQTIAKKHTDLMKQFHQQGTMWIRRLKAIIETPLFVDSSLTSMVQIADLCAYSFRRYLENNETELFDLVFQKADTKDGVVVGVRHYTHSQCNCKICASHRKGK
ncbi:MAG: DUF3800 domain-containing protein [Dehalococcoidales bacterium]|nr:DUF3800 domain-containing protein [Dehalococcoidales bacterium]